MKKVLILNKETLEFETKEVEGKVGLKVIREGVEGYIERVSYNRKLEEAHIDVWCNEEGKLEDLKPSVAVVKEEYKVVEVLAGNLVFTKESRDGESYGLTDKEIELVKEELQVIVKFHSSDRKGNHKWDKVRIMKFN